MVADVMIQKLAPSEWIALTSILIDVIAMLVGGLLAIWVVQRIQTKMDAEQKLKDYFFSELLDIREGYKNIMSDLYRHRLKAKEFTHRMTTLSQLSTEIMQRLKGKYSIDDQELVNYRLDLNVKVTERLEYTSSYRRNSVLEFPDDFEMELRTFVSTTGSEVFNNIFLKIYSS